LNDGSSLPAKVVGRDLKTDLALLKVNPLKSRCPPPISATATRRASATG
jgi:S1-C subfamily serine protease